MEEDHDVFGGRSRPAARRRDFGALDDVGRARRTRGTAAASISGAVDVHRDEIGDAAVMDLAISARGLEVGVTARSRRNQGSVKPGLARHGVVDHPFGKHGRDQVDA